MCAGMFTYFYVLNDYGVPFHTVIFLTRQFGYSPADGDIYNPYEPNFGNSNYGITSMMRNLNFGKISDETMDMRLFYSYKVKEDWS